MLASSFKGFEDLGCRSTSDVPRMELSLASIAVSLRRLADAAEFANKNEYAFRVLGVDEMWDPSR